MSKYKCKCKKKKVIEVEFNVKPLEKIDIWILCKDCNSKDIFKDDRISEKVIGDSN